MKAFTLEGKKAVITGGGSGIGFGIASIFIDAGCEVMIIGRTEQKLSDAQKKLGNNCYYLVYDVNQLSNIPDLIIKIENILGQIDVLVNCAGTHLKKYAVETSDQEFLEILNTHLMSVFALTREYSKRMMQRKRGSILLISSMTAVMGMEQVVAYSTAKTAILGMMRSMVAELARYNIRINTIAPGWIETPMLYKAIEHDEPRKQKILNRIPSSNFGKPEDVGYAALYLASEAGNYINGIFLPVDGGAVGGF